MHVTCRGHIDHTHTQYIFVICIEEVLASSQIVFFFLVSRNVFIALFHTYAMYVTLSFLLSLFKIFS